jgi:hypothetical protein
MITLTTILYESNFFNFFNDKKWFWNYNHELITEKLLVINNLSSEIIFNDLVNEFKKKYNFKICFVKDFEEFSLKKFNLNLDKNNTGYVYSTPYFVMFTNVKTDYVLNVATDCMDDIFMDDNFIYESINLLKTNNNCLLTSLPSSKNNEPGGVLSKHNGLTVGEHETISHNLLEYKTNSFCPTYDFADHLFLTSIKNMEETDFNSPEGGKYHGPSYCGEICFEKKIVDYSCLCNKFRFIYNKNSYYIHNS